MTQLRRTRVFTGAVALTAALLATSPAPVAAAGTAMPTTCSDLTVTAGEMRCFSTVDPTTVTPAEENTTAPDGLSPQDIASLYDLPAVPADVPTGSGPTVAVVDAGGTPTLESDLAAYREQYGLGECSIASGCLTVMSQTGSTGNLPALIDGWDFETALDAEAVASACPACRILVVQADSANADDLDAATATAADRAPYVSMSFGSDDATLGASDVASTEAIFAAHPDVTFVAASGDLGYATYDRADGEICGGDVRISRTLVSANCAQYPATSAHVIAVGGTTATNAGTAAAPSWSQTAWNPQESDLNGGGASSGCSGWAAMPAAQASAAQAVAACGSARAATDISAVADGFAMYHPDPEGSGRSWWVAGGTSLSSPLIAAMYARAGNNTDPFDIYTRAAAEPSAFTDVTAGATRGCDTTADTPHLCSASTGWDGPTGLGTPHGLASLQPYTPRTTSTTTSQAPKHVAHRGRVRVLGTARVGAVLRASYGVFTPSTKVSVAWFVDGHRVASGRRLRVRRGWRHERIRYVVTASATGFTSLSLSSPVVRIR